jgi:hypothetical protein
MCDTDGASNEATKARRAEDKRQADIRRGTKDINATFDSQFGDKFFNKQGKAYRDYAMPQLETQRADAAKELTFSLARSGLLDSSSRSNLEAELQRTYDLQRQDIADKAQATANQARTSVEDARTNLITTLTATGDAKGAAQGAINRAQTLAQPQAYSPLASLFANFTAGLGTQAAAERSFNAGGARPTYVTGLFSSGGVQNR